ncbi:hypothetical protein GCM10010399_62450 [Dactylosporangium fulvum]|uniref:Uncharacterized protein n=1 Tax=Dactylosporangium fulvum TaxID=53359 RepID=A0ABY5W328_9ACTN|nr:hypothetical protein [Dactylosporangium fulvum]UWP82481.1 hypothetical protein Dfulv_46835 [Dactylosporangium fulvum]
MHIDESNAGELLGPLSTDPLQPSSIDVGRAMQEGRRRRARRTAVTSGVAGLTVLAMAGVPVAITSMQKTDNSTLVEASASAAPPATAAPSASPPVTAAPSASSPPPKAPPVPTSCKAERLPIPDNVTMALVTAADPTGRTIFGRSYPQPGTNQVILWRDGKATKIDVPGDAQAINSVNAGGTAVGESTVDGKPVAWLFSDGKVTRLPGGDGATAEGINAGNVIVGSRNRRPLIWRTPASDPVELPLPDGASNGEAHAIDDDGTAVGTITTGTGSVAYAWAADGTGRILPTVGDPGNLGYTAFTVRNGWATGVSTATGLRWNLRTGQVEAVPGINIRPSTANTSGWMVGTDMQGRGVLIAAGRTLVLPDVFVHRPGGFSNLPKTISDDGRVLAGQADDTDHVIHAVVWRCS